MSTESTELTFNPNPAATRAPAAVALAAGALSIINLDAASINDLVNQIAEYYLDGYNSPVEALIFANKLAKIADGVKEKTADAATNELKLEKSENRTMYNVKISEQTVGARYNFDNCGSSKYNKLKADLKAEEEFLKTVKGSKTVVYEDSGEVETVYEPTKSGKQALVLKVL